MAAYAANGSGTGNTLGIGVLGAIRGFRFPPGSPISMCSRRTWTTPDEAVGTVDYAVAGTVSPTTAPNARPTHYDFYYAANSGE